MPKLTNERLETSAPQGFTSPNASSDIGAGIALAREGISDLASVFTSYQEKKDASVLSSFEQEASEVVEQASAYNTVRTEILSKAKGADKATFDALDKTLSQIRRGEIQGVIDPSTAASEIARLNKKYQNIRPGLAGDIRKLTQAYFGEVASIQSLNDLDPVAKAQEQLWQEATARGWTYDAMVAYNNDLAVAQQAKSTAELKLANGDAGAALAVSEFVTKSATLPLMREQWETLDARFKAGSFVKEDALQQLGVMRGQLYNEFTGMMATYEAEHGVIFRDKERMFKEVAAPLDILEKLIPQIDSSDKAARLSRDARTILDNGKVKALYDVLGAASVFATTPEGAVQVVTDMSNIAKRLQSGQLATIERLAQLDPYTRLLLDSMKNGQSWGTLARAVVDRAEGSPAETLPPGFAREADNIVWQRAGAPGSTMADRQKVFTNMVNGMHPIEGLHRNLDVLADVIKVDTGAQGVIEKRMISAMGKTVRQLDAQVLNNLTWAAGQGFVYNGPQTEGSEANPFYVQNDMYQEPIRDKKSSGAKAAEYLNRYYDIIRTYKNPDEAAQFVSDLLNDSLEARYAQLSTEQRGLINRTTYDVDDAGYITVNGKADPNWAPSSEQEANLVVRQLSARYPERAKDFEGLFNSADFAKAE